MVVVATQLVLVNVEYLFTEVQRQTEKCAVFYNSVPVAVVALISPSVPTGTSGGVRRFFSKSKSVLIRFDLLVPYFQRIVFQGAIPSCGILSLSCSSRNFVIGTYLKFRTITGVHTDLPSDQRTIRVLLSRTGFPSSSSRSSPLLSFRVRHRTVFST